MLSTDEKDRLMRRRIKRASIRVFNGQGDQIFDYNNEYWKLCKARHGGPGKFVLQESKDFRPTGVRLWAKGFFADDKNTWPTVEQIMREIDDIYAQSVVDS